MKQECSESISTNFTAFPELGLPFIERFDSFLFFLERLQEISLSDSKYDLNDSQNDSGDLIYGQNDIQTKALPTDKPTDGRD